MWGADAHVSGAAKFSLERRRQDVTSAKHYAFYLGQKCGLANKFPPKGPRSLARALEALDCHGEGGHATTRRETGLEDLAKEATSKLLQERNLLRPATKKETGNRGHVLVT